MRYFNDKSLLLGLALVIGILPAAAFAQSDVDLKTFRPYGPDDIYLFEAPQLVPSDFDGMTIYLGAAFTQQFQALTQSNDAVQDVDGDGVPENRLVDIGAGFNLATANLYLGAMLTEGIRVNLTTYLSSRHHPEAWVKGGYLLVDGAPFLRVDGIDRLMDYITLKVGHFEINYGDAHFRRTDNGNAMLNPFVGNYILDSFTTEIGGEVYVRSSGFLAMVGVTGGEIKGSVVDPDSRSPSIYGKAGFDRVVADDVRLRLTGSVYTTSKSNNNALFSGDRAGARFYSIFHTAGSEPFTTPRANPNFRDDVTAFQINPFVQIGGLELFGVIEQATGSLAAESENRTVNQYAVEAIYRFLERRQLYVGGRYNVVNGEQLPFSTLDVSSTRVEVGAGWFVTPNILLKGEYVQQTWDDYPEANIFHGGEFSGFTVEGVVAF